jgi:hypothetical protein
MRGRLEDRFRSRRLDHVPLLHHDDAIAIGGGEAKIVGDQDGRHAALARQFDHEIHHRLLGRHVEPGGGLVGDQELRPARERKRDDDALAHAAREFERIGVVALARPRDPNLLEGFDRLFGGIVGCRLHVPHQDVRDLPADLADGIESGARVLEDHRDFAATQVAHGLFGRIVHIETGEAHRALGDAAGAIEDAHHRIGGDRLARARLADDRQRFALGQREVDMLDGTHGAAAGVEFDREIANVEKGKGRGGHVFSPLVPTASLRGAQRRSNPGAARKEELDCFASLAMTECEWGTIAIPHVRRCGSTMSRRPSPKRLKQNTATIRARPGKNAIHHSPDTMKAAPSATMMPHSAVGGRTPSPMKERPAALRMA